jgi:hypothetical protein
MFTLTVAALAMTLLPERWQPCWGHEHAGLPALGLAIIILGGLITIFRRLSAIVQHLQRSP